MNNCHRCQGLMCPEDFLDRATAPRNHDSVGAWRCITCGEIIDPIIVVNRLGRSSQRSERRQTKLHLPVCVSPA